MRLTSNDIRVPVAWLRRLGQPLDNIVLHLKSLLLRVGTKSLVQQRPRHKVVCFGLPTGRGFGEGQLSLSGPSLSDSGAHPFDPCHSAPSCDFQKPRGCSFKPSGAVMYPGD